MSSHKLNGSATATSNGVAGATTNGTTEHELPPFDESKYTQSEVDLWKKLTGPLHQRHLFPSNATASDIKRLLKDIETFDNSYPSGISGYIKNAKKLLTDAAAEVNPFDGYSANVPSTEMVNVGQSDYLSREELGMKEMERTAFVLVAGGMGERLGYPGIKVSLPTDICSGTSYLQHYSSCILSYQNSIKKRTGRSCELPLAIMTSDDTHQATHSLLMENNLFGLLPTQVTLMKQEAVPTLIDNEARLGVEASDRFKLNRKPHGHGDVHSLLLASGLINEWNDKGFRWVLFFQDTNGLIFRTLPILLGTSKHNGLKMNSAVIPRRPGDAVGAICKLVHATKPSMTVNVEYNVLDGLLKTSSNLTTNVDAQGFSLFPGNTNILLFSLDRYREILIECGGAMPEFVNPKYTDESKTQFKSPTRLECMMQDFARFYTDEDKVACTQLQRWASFSPLKNSIAVAAKKSETNPWTECAFTAESDEYTAAARFLRLAAHMKGTVIQMPEPTRATFHGVNYFLGPRIVLKPSWAASIQQMMNHIGRGTIKISSTSILVIEGDVDIDGLELDGTLILKAQQGAKFTLKNAIVKNEGWKFVEISNLNDTRIPDALKIRGYGLQKLASVEKVIPFGSATLEGELCL